MGKPRDPWAVVVLCVVTLGIYFFVWAWKTSKEFDAFMVRPGHSHGKMRVGITLQIVGLLVLLIGFIVMLPDLLIAMETPEGTEPDMDVGRLALAGLSILLGVVLAITGWIVRVVAFYKLWKMIEEEDTRRLSPKPFNTTLPLVLVILGLFIPYVGWVLALVAYFLTQDALNKIWSAYQPTPQGSGF